MLVRYHSEMLKKRKIKIKKRYSGFHSSLFDSTAEVTGVLIQTKLQSKYSGWMRIVLQHCIIPLQFNHHDWEAMDKTCQ